MKKFLSTAIMAGMMLTSATALAAIPSADIALGGIQPGMGIGEAIAAFGQPTYRDHGEEAYFPNGVKIDLDEWTRNTIEEIHLTRPGSGVATPAGITVGSAESEIQAAYGSPDKMDYDDGAQEYTYYATDSAMKLKIEAVRGSVVKIKCDMYD